MENGFCICNNGSNVLCFLLVWTGPNITIFWTTESRAKIGQVQSLLLILDRVWLGHFTCGSGWVRSRKLDPRPTLVTLTDWSYHVEFHRPLHFLPRCVYI